MSEVTLELVQAKQSELAELIEKLRRKSATTTLHVPAADIVLFDGEWYAGEVLNEDGSIKHRIAASTLSDDKMSFDEVQALAASRGLSAPTKQESRLIVAHRYSRLAGMNWFWTCEEYEGDSACAWNCGLGYGTILTNDRGAAGGAVAVRLIPLVP